jgi:hypothetical protein
MRKVWVNKAYSFKEAEEFDRRFWREAGVSARFSAVWWMVKEWFKMRGKGGAKPRLRRSIQGIERRSAPH